MDLIVFLALIGLLIVLMLLRIPVPFALAATSLLGYLFLVVFMPGRSFSFGLVAQRTVAGLDSFTLIAIPLFLFAGNLMNNGGITDRLFDFSLKVIGPIRGGLGHVNVLGSLIFSGMSGAAVADVAGLGTIEIRAMKEAGYHTAFACAVTGASSIIGPIVPPSIPMVVYAVLAGISPGKLFLGGIVPGVIMSAAMMIMVAIISARRRYPVGERSTWAEKWRSLRQSFFPLMAPVIIVGGIWTGWFTPTEAACIGSVYAIVLSVIVYRTVSPSALYRVFRSTMLDSVTILLILAVSTFYSTIITMLRVPYTLGDFLIQLTNSPLVLLAVINLFIFVMGFFIPAMVIINVFTPILVPVTTRLGIDPIFFGVIMVFNSMIGMLTPPYGIVLFTLNKISDAPLQEIIREIVPFIVVLVLVLILLIAVPELVTFIPYHAGF